MWRFVSRRSSVFRFRCRLPGFCSPWLRVALLALGIAFVSRSMQAEMLAVSLYDGRPHTLQEWLDGAQELGDLFGVDRHIRLIRGDIRRRVDEALKQQGADQ